MGSSCPFTHVLILSTFLFFADVGLTGAKTRIVSKFSFDSNRASHLGDETFNLQEQTTNEQSRERTWIEY